MVVVIFDYTLEELLLFLKDLDESQIKESRHFIESNITRNEDIGMIYDLLLNEKPVQVDLIIMIINRQEITLKTIYTANSSRRLREHEPN